MFGALGLSARLIHWTQEALQATQEAIAQYKRLRPLLKRSRFYHLLPQVDLQCPDLDLGGRWEAYAVIAEDRSQGALWIFRDAKSESTYRLPLRGLDATLIYTLRDIDTARAVRRPGATLMEQGLVVDLGERTSALLLIEAEPRDSLR